MDDYIAWLAVAGVGALLLYMTLWFGLARLKRRLDVVDTAWGGSPIVLAWLAVATHPAPATLLVAALVTVWGGRLMRHTWARHCKHDQDDPRYTRLSAGWKRGYWLQVYLKVFVQQGILAFIVAAPVVLNVRADSIGPWAIAGGALWLTGFYFEYAADRQLRDFLARPDHPEVMDQGLWRYSRHPNYFGESLQWFGLGVVALAAPWGWLGLVGPGLLTILLLFVSGIPTVERGKHKDSAYRAYQRRTSPFIPLPPRG